jgi:hypothetical protein
VVRVEEHAERRQEGVATWLSVRKGDSSKDARVEVANRGGEVAVANFRDDVKGLRLALCQGRIFITCNTHSPLPSDEAHQVCKLSAFCVGCVKPGDVLYAHATVHAFGSGWSHKSDVSCTKTQWLEIHFTIGRGVEVEFSVHPRDHAKGVEHQFNGKRGGTVEHCI